MIPKIWEKYPALAMAVKRAHEDVGLVASGHDFDHDLEVAQLAFIVLEGVDNKAAVLAGVAGLLHSIDRILERSLGIRRSTISEVSEQDVREASTEMLSQHTDIRGDDAEEVIVSVIYHGSKPNQNGDSLVMKGVADADRLANMGANLPIRSGQHYGKLRVLNPVTIQEDRSDRTPREKYNNPDSVLYDIQNAINWYRNPEGPYALRLPKSKEIGKLRAERLERLIRDIKEERELVGLYPYPKPFL